jgi:hypothetical protein
MILAVLIVALAWHFDVVRKKYSCKTEQISQGPDAFYVDPQRKGRAVKQAYQVLRDYTVPEATFVALPEGVMLNYLTRRTNPTRYISFMPPELSIFGQEKMLFELRANPPDFVVQVSRGLREYGYRGLGVDYATELSKWMRMNYWRKQIIGKSRRVTPEKIYIYDIYLRWPVNQAIE